ncbi:T9SS C-terminal target domain-containing protein, partial [bacterium]|nr:T9SS C-terminal target domain-containing protein [bacterium]
MILSLALFLFSVATFAQAPSIVWQTSLGGSYRDHAYSIQQTADGGFIVAGESVSNDGDVSGNHGDGDYWVVKLNS